MCIGPVRKVGPDAFLLCVGRLGSTRGGQRSGLAQIVVYVWNRMPGTTLRLRQYA